jgi:hypothetical protein
MSSSNRPLSPHFHLLTDRQLALRWSISRRTLQRWRCAGDGPPFLLVGRCVRYRAGDAEDWLACQNGARLTPAGEVDHDTRR